MAIYMALGILRLLLHRLEMFFGTAWCVAQLPL
jgi:hypothetical protein